MNMLKSLIIALAMYSKLPVPNIDWDEKNMRYAMCFFPVVGGDYRSAGIRRRSADSSIYRVRKTLFCGGNDDDTGRCDRGDSFGWVCGYDRCRQFL